MSCTEKRTASPKKAWQQVALHNPGTTTVRCKVQHLTGSPKPFEGSNPGGQLTQKACNHDGGMPARRHRAFHFYSSGREAHPCGVSVAVPCPGGGHTYNYPKPTAAHTPPAQRSNAVLIHFSRIASQRERCKRGARKS